MEPPMVWFPIQNVISAFKYEIQMLSNTIKSQCQLYKFSGHEDGTYMSLLGPFYL
jgi:hypothetical protein